ncbi:MAG: hypothetical protein IMY76_06260 [Chloroflexi bacterium]|nr:hypothetical protein [Chloroflexota bacterium]
MTRRDIFRLGIISALSMGTYLLASYYYFHIGFPLDDAWIHQTYARNLAMRAEWAFMSGVPSSGSTGPLWPSLLSIGYLLKLAPYIWTFFLGWLSLWGIVVLGTGVFSALTSRYSNKSFWVGLLLALEWHLVWAAASGMETLIFALLILSVLGLLVRIEHLKEQIHGWSWMGLGVLIGISVWLRPDGVTLLGPALVAPLIILENGSQKIRSTIITILGFILIFLPYLLFNRFMAGSWWPNTFYAKQAEYAILQNLPFWKRLIQLGVMPLVGVGVVLLPGIILLIKKNVIKKKWAPILGFIWFMGYLSLFAWRLPVTYQHGRYLIPMMPVFFVWSCAGFSEYLDSKTNNLMQRVTKKSWILITIILLLVFWVKGAMAYARDVAVIESEMVTVAHWVNQNLAPDIIVAAHDIGALGYFTERRILDLAGLISPDVIPFIRDEAALKKYLDDQNANYLITFPNWYTILQDSATLIFQTQGKFSSQFGEENMAVYLWKLP